MPAAHSHLRSPGGEQEEGQGEQRVALGEGGRGEAPRRRGSPAREEGSRNTRIPKTRKKIPTLSKCPRATTSPTISGCHA